MISTKKKNDKNVYDSIEGLKDMPEELFFWRFVQILAENGMLPYWVLIYSPNERFRIL